MFSPLVLAQWIPDSLGGLPDGGVVVSVDPTLTAKRSVSLLRLDDGAGVLSLSPARASELGFTDGEHIDGEDAAARIAGAGLSMNDPDHLFYLTVREQEALRDEVHGAQTRQLTSDDAGLFEEFTRGAPEDERDEAFVELDHWLVYGTLVDGALACAASMYPWGGGRLADVGVITHPEFRGRGLGRATVRAISAEAMRRGYEPQYRCQRENTASIALARRSGFTHFGEWEVVVPTAD